MSFPFYKQLDEMDCGPSCLRMICKYYGRTYSLNYLTKVCNTTREGSTFLSISEAAEKIGFRSIGVKLTYEDLLEDEPFPCIAHWYQRHFVIVYKIKTNKVYVADPAHGLITYTKEEFLKGWALGGDEGVILSLDPLPEFYQVQGEENITTEKKIKFLLPYLVKYKSLITQLFVGLVAASLLQLILPFLTQSIVDIGIQQNNLGFIYIILAAQLLIFAGRISIELLRGYILMHLSSRININLLTDFFIKLMRLPLSFFDVKMSGDVLQRMADHQRVETFLTSGTLNILFSVINLVVFSIVLAIYSPLIFSVFLIGSIFYFLWITVFLKRRADLDYKRFNQLSVNQEKNLELIYGMQEIKLNNAERNKRWQWEHLQVKLFKINLKSLTLRQIQSGGAGLINELKNIIIVFLAAKLVINGEITLGVMLSISYINGQLNGPILQLVDFIQSYQDARLSLERINEIHSRDNEEITAETAVDDIPRSADLILRDVCFKYDSSPSAKYILNKINLTIPKEKVTAIVGSSGSGKTTLLKLLLKFYDPSEGSIHFGDTSLHNIYHHMWRNKCGVVMQEGYIFSDTIANNIAVGEDNIHKVRLLQATDMANIANLVYNMPLKFNTKIGQNGVGLSTGQKQRVLIARAIYRNPDLLFFDEATSALDANTEKIITENLEQFYKGKTVVIIAHRLSTVKNADKIIVLEKGEIAEEGTHKELVEKSGLYYTLIKNQLELGA